MRSRCADHRRRGAAIAAALCLFLHAGANAQHVHTPTKHKHDDNRQLCGCSQLAPPEAVLGVRGTHTTSTRWPDGVVPYTFDDNVSGEQRQRALEAMREIEAVALVTFVERTTESNHIHLVDSNGNASYVGMIGGAQAVHLYNWNHRYVVVHELMHALGAHHEQSRPDRDQYVTINTQNVQDGRLINFDIHPDADAHGPYDFESIMHYGQFAFSANGQPTITVLAPNQQYQGVIGQLNYLSDGDIALLQHLYHPNSPVPFAADDHVTLEGAPPYIIPAGMLLSNDFDLDGDPLQIASHSQGDAGGTITIGQQGDFVYNPPSPSFVGIETFTYTLADDDGADTARVDLRVPVRGDIIHVDAGATGNADGLTWQNAMTSLAGALVIAEAGDEIRVAAGTYRPGVTRTATFRIPTGVRVLGAYPPGGAGERDPHDESLATQLSGDLSGNDSSGILTDNAYHVVTIIDADDTTILDGFVISGGNADGTGTHASGGGLRIEGAIAGGTGGGAQVRRCLVTGNRCAVDGAGVLTRNASPAFIACRFRGNTSTGDDGGAAYCEAGAPRFESCIFDGNNAADLAGAIYAFGGAFVRVAGCTITDNHAADRAGAVFINAGSTVEIRGSILWGNRADLAGDAITAINGGLASVSRSIVEGGADGVRLESGLLNWLVGNAAHNPVFADRLGPDATPATGDERFEVLPGSPAIDAGDNGALTAWPTDASGNTRRIDAAGYDATGNGVGSIADIGALEAPADIGGAPTGAVELRFAISDGDGIGIPIDDDRITLETVDEQVTLYVQARITGDNAATGLYGFQGRIGSNHAGGGEAVIPALLTNAEAFEMLVPPNDDALGRRGMFSRFRSIYHTDNTHPDNGTIDDDVFVFEAFDAAAGRGADDWTSIYKLHWTAPVGAAGVGGDVTLAVTGQSASYASLITDRTDVPVVDGTLSVALPAECGCEADGDPSRVSVADLLAFLDRWVARTPDADFDASGDIGVLDVLAFLDCWVEATSIGCP